jgi:hypothetical protein
VTFNDQLRPTALAINKQLTREVIPELKTTAKGDFKHEQINMILGTTDG